MSSLITRRRVIADMGILSASMLVGCDTSENLAFKYGTDLSNKIIGRTFKLRDSEGEVRILSNFRNTMPMVFFGFTQCPAVCPTTLARAVKIKRTMDESGYRLQVIFITVDPERDTPSILDAYVKSFDPSFVALHGTLEETAVSAKEFEVFYEKVPSGLTHTMSHTATSFVYDYQGHLRLGLAHSLTAKQCTEDLIALMEIC